MPNPMKTPHRFSISSGFSTLAATLFVTALSVQATTYTWVPTTGGAWDTTTNNWNDSVTNPTTWINGSANSASFGAFGTGPTISLGTNIVVGTIITNGGATIQLNGGSGTLDVTQINTAGAVGSNGSIDMFKALTGSHDFTLNSTGTSGNQGRLNLKVASSYTGDTYLTGTAYLLMDTASNSLPTGTTLNMATGTTFRIAGNNLTQQIAGLAGSGTATVTVTSTGNTLTISTKSATTTTFSGTLTSATANLVINGSGTQALNGTNSFSGTTTISGGTLSLGSNLASSSSVIINGGTLTSSIANVNLGIGGVSLATGGTIDPRGTGSAGTFTLAANQLFSTTGGTMNFTIGTSFDKIIGSGTGTFSIGSGTTLALTLGTGFSYANTYNILNGFSSGTVAGTGFTITGYDTTNWVASLDNTGTLSFSASAIPEPSTYALILGGFAVAFTAFYRRRQSRD